MAFSDPAGKYPAAYDNGLFFADYTRSCIGVIPAGSGGLPDPAQAQVFATGTCGHRHAGTNTHLDGRRHDRLLRPRQRPAGRHAAGDQAVLSLILHHCATPTDCHTHDVQDFHGVASGSFSAPDHEYPAWIELQLTATDSGGLTDTASVRSTPRRWTSPSAPTRPDCSSRRAAAPPPRRSPAP